jgi:MFS family permease
MGSRQVIVVILMVFLNALDGFDVLSSAFAAPGIMQEWGIDRTALGVVLSAELVGMGFGSVLLGGAADRFGRKNTMLVCLVVMAVGMYMASRSDAVAPMTIWRFFTGLGIGGMLASTNAVVAEVTSRTGRSVSMAFYVIGYPVGGVIGGFAAQGWLLIDYDWRAVFIFGAVVTAAMIPLVMLLVPETPAYFVARRPEGALEKTNKSLAAFGKSPIASLPVIEDTGPKPKATDILANPRLRPITLLLAFGYMFHTFTFYYILKNAPTIVALSGYTQAEGASSLTYANIGGAVGGALFGFFLKKFGLKGPTLVALALGVGAVVYFGLGHESLWDWRIAALLSMFFLNAAIVGYYAAFALSFPAYARASGTGFVLGVGRLGAAGSPLVAGYLFDTINGGQDNLLTVSIIMSLGSVAAMILMWVMPIRDADDEMDVASAESAKAAA